MPVDVAAAIIEKDGKVLAARRAPGRHLAGLWEFPGGKVEERETPEACLFRELEEELAVTVAVGDLVAENIHDYGTKRVRLLAYSARIVEGKPSLRDHDALLWLEPRNLRSINWAPADIPLVDAYLEQLSE